MRTRPGARALAATTVSSSLLCALLAAAAQAQSQAQSQVPLTREAFVERVLRESLPAKLAETEVRLAEAERRGAGLLPNPALEYTRQTAAGVNSPPQDVLVASIPLVLSGRLGLERASAGRAVEAAAARRTRALAELRHQATEVFVRLSAATQREQAFAEAAAALDEALARIAARHRAGETSGYDAGRMELEQGLLDDARAALAVEALRLRGEALRLLGADALEPLALAADSAALAARPSAEQLLSELDARRADLQALEHEAAAAGLAARAAGARAVPDPELSAGPLLVDLGNPGSGTGLLFGVRLPLPLFEHGQREKAAAGVRRDDAELRREILRREARLRLSAALATLALREEQALRHRTRVLARAGELRRVAAAAYAAGEAELLVLVDAERALREARLRDVELTEAVRLVENDLMLISGAYDAAAGSR